MAKMSEFHDTRIIKAQLNGMSEDEYFADAQNTAKDNIKKIFWDTNLSISKFALQTGVSRACMAKLLEVDDKNVDLTTICRIGANFGVPLYSFFLKNEIQSSSVSAGRRKKKEKQIVGQLNMFDYFGT